MATVAQRLAALETRTASLESRLSAEITGRAAAVKALDDRLKRLEGVVVTPPPVTPPVVVAGASFQASAFQSAFQR